MAAWLAEDHKLNPSEIAQVIGAAAEYRVSEVADRNAGVVSEAQEKLSQPVSSAEVLEPIPVPQRVAEAVICGGGGMFRSLNHWMLSLWGAGFEWISRRSGTKIWSPESAVMRV